MVASITPLSPTSGPVGTIVTITGSGFALTSAITFTYGGVTIVPNDAPITSDGSGGFTAHITVPASVKGVHAVVATDASLGTASANFTVTQAISLSPSTQRIGGSTTVTGSGFATLSLVAITIGGVSVTSVTTDANGSFSIAETVPTLASGTRSVSATDAATNNATANLTVSAPTLTRSPTHGPKGTTVQLNGANYIPNHSITITNIDGTTSTVTADSSGNLPTNTPITSGPNVQGSHNITASDGTNTATAAFTTDPSISLSPTSAKVGATVTITGEGFANASAVTSTFGGAGVTTSPSSPQGNSSGHFTATFVIPASIHGNHTVSCTDAASNNATATESTLQDASIDPSEGPAGELITITGSGFGNAKAVTLTLDGITVSPVSPITSGSDGSVSGTLQLSQSLAQGVHTIVITDADGNAFSLTYTVNEDLVIQVTVHNPSKQYAGLPTGIIDEEGIPVANDSYVTVGLINMYNFIRATLEMYNAHASNGLTFSILGMIDDGSGLVPDATSDKWLAITAYTDVSTSSLSGKLVEITTRYSWLRIDVKRTTSTDDATLDIYGKLQAF